jgi:hypothetical protein
LASHYSFLEDGVESLTGVLDASACQALYDRILADRPFAPEMFLAEASYRAKPVRYFLRKDASDADTLLDRANAGLTGAGSLVRTRRDVDEAGAFLQRTNVIGGNKRAD